MQNFEALGRYVTAEGEARKLASERDLALDKAKDLIMRSTGGGREYDSTIAYNFDPDPIRELITKAAELHGKMVDAVMKPIVRPRIAANQSYRYALY